MPALPKTILILLATTAVLGGLWVWSGPKPAAATKGTALTQVVVPEFAGDAVIGARAFAVKCAACHGESGAGVDGAGPPLIHKIYEPNHHGDAAFFNAAQNGVGAHHWPFGDMPPVEGITKAEIGSIVSYIRAIQKANGIF